MCHPNLYSQLDRLSADQAVKSLCDIWRPEDIPQTFITGCSRPATELPPSDRQAPSIATLPPLLSRNSQLPSPITPSTQPSPAPYSFPVTCEPTSSQPQQLVPLKGFVHEVLRRSRTSGSVLQTALCYLEAIRSKVPELVEKEKNGTGVQGEIDLSYRVVQGDLEAEEWRELALDSVMASFIDMDAAVDSDARDLDAMPTMKVPEHREVMALQLSHSAQSLSASSSMAGLKSHIAQQTLAKKPKVPSGPLPPMSPLPSPLLCPRRTFLASLILASKFTQDRCYSNKAWAKLSGLPPREIGRCERALGDALDWRLWVGKAPTNNRPVSRSQSDGDLFAETSKAIPSLPSSGLRRSSTVPASAFQQDPFSQIPSVSEAPWELLAWPSSSTFGMPNFLTPPSSNGSSPSTPALSHSPSSTDSSSGDRTIQMSSFVDAMPSPAQLMPTKSFSNETGYSYMPHHHAVYDVDPTSGLSFPLYSTHGMEYHPHTAAPGIVSDQMYWTG